MSHEFPPPPQPEPEHPGTPGASGAAGSSATPGPYGPPGSGPAASGQAAGQQGTPGQYGAAGQYERPAQYGTPGQYAAPGPYGAPPGYPQRPVATSTTGAKVMTFIGIGLILVAIAALIAGIVQVATSVSRFTDTPSGSSPALDYVQLPGELSFTADDGEEYAIVVTSTSSRTIDLDDVVVAAPDGTSVPLSTSSLNFENSTYDSHTDVRALTFTAPEDGVYTVLVIGSSADLPGSMTAVNASELGKVIGRTALGVVSIVVSGLCGTLGLGLAIGGGIWWNTRSKAGRRAAPWPPAPGSPPPPPPPPYGTYQP